MKKKIMFLLGIALSISGCTHVSTDKERTLSVKSAALAFSDDTPIFDTDEVYEFREYSTYENEKAETEKKIYDHGEELTGNYAYSYADPFTNYDIDVYINDQSNIMFEVQKDTEQVIGCQTEAGIETQLFSEVTSEEELLSLSADFAGQYIDMEYFEPVISTQVIVHGDDETSSRNETGFYLPAENEEAYYVVTYFYMIDDVKTFEKLEINIVDDVINSYYYTLPGVFSECEDHISLDDAAVPEIIDGFVSDNISDECQDVRYDIVDTYLSVDESGNYILISFLDVDYKTNGQNGNAVETIVLKLE